MPTFDAVSGGATTGANVASFEFSHTFAGSDRVAYVAVTSYTSDITGVTIGGVSMTLIENRGTANVEIKIYRLIAPASGAQTVSVALSPNGTGAALCLSVHGAHQTTPNGTPVFVEGTGVESTSANVSSVSTDLAAYFTAVSAHDLTATGATLANAFQDTARASFRIAASYESGVNGTSTGGFTDFADTVVAGNVAGADYTGTSDTYLNQVGPTTNYNGSGDLALSAWASNDKQHTLMKFDGLSSLPAGAVIVSASLFLYLHSADASGSFEQTINMRRVLVSWTLGQTTWNVRSTGVNWNTGGALGLGTDVSNTLTVALNVSNTIGWKEWTSAQLAQDIQNIVDGVDVNHGWLLNPVFGQAETYRVFRSSEYTSNTVRPYLRILYRPSPSDHSLIAIAIHASPATGTVELTSVAGTGAAGTLRVPASEQLTGVSATGARGTLSVAGMTPVSLVSVTATGGVGQMVGTSGVYNLQQQIDTAAISNIRYVPVGTYPRVLLPEVAIPVNTAFLGSLLATGSLGTLTSLRQPNTLLSGAQATTELGAVRPAYLPTLTTVVGTSGLGTMQVGVGNRSAPLSGVAATGTRGSLALGGRVRTLSGVQGAGHLGTAFYFIPGAITSYDFRVASQPVTGLKPGWRITNPANNKGTLSAVIISEDGSYTPQLDEEIIVLENGVRVFGGNITSVRTRGVGGEQVYALEHEITALDFNALASRRMFDATIPAGSLRSFLQTVMTALTGVTLDPTQAEGPMLPQMEFHLWRPAEIYDHLTEITGGWIWEIDYHKVLRMFPPSSVSAPFNVTQFDTIALGDITVEPTRMNYANHVGVYGTGVNAVRFDLTEIGRNGPWETFIEAPDSKTQIEVDTLAEQILAKSLPTLKKVVYDTYMTGAKPGMSQTIVSLKRHINNIFLITDVATKEIAPGLTRKTITAIEGLVYQYGWREQLKEFGGAGRGIIKYPGGGVTSGQAFARYMVFLGGFGEFRYSDGPTWIPASDHAPQIHAAARGTTAGSVTARVKTLDPGVPVTVRLRDISDGSVKGTSVEIPNAPDWVPVTFAVTLDPGSHFYQLEVLAGVAGAGVAVIGWFE